MALELRKFWQGHRRGGAIALLLLAVLFIGLVIIINYGLRGVRADLTENRLYTLAPGTRSILKNIDGQRVTIHCTVTSQIADRPGYLDEFLGFWTAQPQVVKVWFSIFTPQRGATDPEILSPAQRTNLIADLRQLGRKYPTLEMPESLIREIASPPASPEHLRPYHADHLRRSPHARHALPVWRRS